MKKCLKIQVYGTVQGVGYRQFIQKKAHDLKIEGTAQNSEDGSVLLFVCGSTDNLDDFIDALYEGSPKSKVDDVIAESYMVDRDYRGVFRIIGVD